MNDISYTEDKGENWKKKINKQDVCTTKVGSEQKKGIFIMRSIVSLWELCVDFLCCRKVTLKAGDALIFFCDINPFDKVDFFSFFKIARISIFPREFFLGDKNFFLVPSW